MAKRPLASQVLTRLNMHIAAVVLLLVFDLVLGTKLLVAWHNSHSDQTEQYTADLQTYARLKLDAGRLRNLPAALRRSHTRAGIFVDDRIPATDSQVAVALGELTARSHVRLGRATYAYARAISGLTELRIDANITGEYTPIMHFLNDVERDKSHAFFIIRSITLTGQQGGVVNLRVRMTTFMRSNGSPAPVTDAGTAAEAQ